MSTDKAITTGNALIGYLARHPGKGGEHRRVDCLTCGADCGRVALVELAYVFEICSCGEPYYDHLVERLMHRKCLRGD